MKHKYIKLILSLIFDFLGILPLLLPGIGETIDVIWAPLSSLILLRMYGRKKGKYAAIINFTEEILPFSDFVPSFTLAWLYFNYVSKA